MWTQDLKLNLIYQRYDQTIPTELGPGNSPTKFVVFK